MIKKQDVKSFKKIVKKVKAGYEDYNQTKRGTNACYFTFRNIIDIEKKKGKLFVTVLEMDDTMYDSPGSSATFNSASFEMEA
ncbi:MAG: hypothetical protein DRH57_03785 [Candidatus Cloacimonadota bacterium]|nr:MAG: hypothetical protein DRH57_03785 [Candidatus Cloacimonadota bacterium]